MEAAAAPAGAEPAPRQALPPTAGGLSRRLSAIGLAQAAGGGGGGGKVAGGTPELLSSPWAALRRTSSELSLCGDEAEAPPRVLCCPMCDSVEALHEGHLEVNALLADDSYLWILAPTDSGAGARGGRRGAARSLLAGIDFSVFGDCGSPPLRSSSGRGLDRAGLYFPAAPPGTSIPRASSWVAGGGRWVSHAPLRCADV
jgi:hypothetical protein